MTIEQQILDNLDQSNTGMYSSFLWLGDAYSHLIDCRLNLFKKEDKWAIVTERLGYNEKAGMIEMQIAYYGNCLINLDEYNGQNPNYYITSPVDFESFQNASDYGMSIKKEAKSIVVRGKTISLIYNEKEYVKAGIELKRYEPDEIAWEELGRLLVSKNRKLYRATDSELYRSIPSSMEKLLVIDEWFHKDFVLSIFPTMTEEQLKQTYEFNRNLRGDDGTSLEDFIQSHRNQENLHDQHDKEMWENNRPSSYETWQLIAKVLDAGDTSLYQPTLKPNTHWKNWEESGSM